jgi:hypothetical protein
MPQLDPHDPHIADIFRRATQEREQQDRRLADIFGTPKVPKVTEGRHSPSISGTSHSIWRCPAN